MNPLIKSEILNPKPEIPHRGSKFEFRQSEIQPRPGEQSADRISGIRPSAFFRPSDFGLRIFAFLALLLPATCLADIPEPDTIFYGKIINRTSQQEYLLTQGTLSWLVSRPDGKQIALSAKLSPL